MNEFSWTVIFAIICLIVVVILFLIVFREAKIAKLQRRFKPFALAPIHKNQISLFDILLGFFWKVTKKISEFLERKKMFQTMCLRYEKFITMDEKNQISKIDYVSIKLEMAVILIAFTFLSFLIFNSSLRLVKVLAAFLIGYYLPDFYLYIKYYQKRKKVEDDLLTSIIIMNNSFKSGRNIMQAVEMVILQLNGPIKDEFRKIYMDMTYGLSIEVVFNRFYERIKLEDAKYIASSLTLLNKTGGNIIKVFSSIEKTFFDKKKLKKEMQSLTSSSIFVFRLLIILPLIFIGGIILMSPNYFAPFFQSPYGFLLFLLIVILYISYIFTVKKVLKVNI